MSTFVAGTVYSNVKPSAWMTFNAIAVNSAKDLKEMQDFLNRGKIEAVKSCIKAAAAFAATVPLMMGCAGLIFEVALYDKSLKSVLHDPTFLKEFLSNLKKYLSDPSTVFLGSLYFVAAAAYKIFHDKSRAQFYVRISDPYSRLVQIYTELGNIEPILVVKEFFKREQARIRTENENVLPDVLPPEALDAFCYNKLYEAYVVALRQCKHFRGPALWNAEQTTTSSGLDMICATFKNGTTLTYQQTIDLSVAAISTRMITAINHLEPVPAYLSTPVQLPYSPPRQTYVEPVNWIRSYSNI